MTEDTRIDITLDPLPFTLSGTLRESDTGDAVACQPVRVEIVNGPDGGRAIEVRSAPNYGGPIPYEMTNVRPGRFTVRASARECGSEEKTDRFRGQPGLHTADFTLLKPPYKSEIKPPATIVVGGPALLVAFPASSPVARLQFMGKAGQAVTVRFTGNTIGDLTIWLLSPGGSEVYSISSTDATFTLAATLRSTAIYEIRVEPSPIRPQTGTVTVSVTSP